MTHRRICGVALTTIIALTVVSGCGSRSGPLTPQLLHVAGNYQITKTGVEDTCGGPLTPVTIAGTVTHAAGGSALVLNDGFTAFNATVASGGSFTIPATSTPPHQGAPITTTFEQGQFTAEGFEARVRLTINGPAGTPPFPACHVVQTWRGVKQGAPNVIV